MLQRDPAAFPMSEAGQIQSPWSQPDEVPPRRLTLRFLTQPPRQRGWAAGLDERQAAVIRELLGIRKRTVFSTDELERRKTSMAQA